MYTILNAPPQRSGVLHPYCVQLHQDGRHLDSYRSRLGAEHARNLLMDGRARYEPHAMLGCKVVPVRELRGPGA